MHCGYSNNKIARELGLDRSTVLRWRLAGKFPERQDVPRSRQVDTFSIYLQQRWDEGCRTGMELWAELRQQRFTGGLDLVRIWIHRRYGPSPAGCSARTPPSCKHPRKDQRCIRSDRTTTAAEFVDVFSG